MAQAPRERLNHLLELAAQGPAGRGALLCELTDLLLDWPADYALAMRGTFEALLEKTAREADAQARAAVARRLSGHEDLPVAILNEFFLEAPCDLRSRILVLNEVLASDVAPSVSADGPALVEAARTTMNGAFAGVFAAKLSLPEDTAREILNDCTGQSLAVACKGAGLDRATFSAIALLTADAPDPARLRHFDAVPEAGAARMMEFWRGRGS
jgi:hypothetical protein